MTETSIVFRVHALERMAERGISLNDVREVLKEGTTIEDYSDDDPYPSRLVLGWRAGRPLHVVVADDEDEDRRIVVSVYEPDPERWSEEFTRRI